MGADVGRGVTVARERMMRFGVPAAIAGVLAGIYLFASPAAHRSTSTMPDRLADSTGEYEDFVTGFVVDDTSVWGRPVGVAVAKDGALLVSEDGNGTIWRVSHSARASALN